MQSKQYLKELAATLAIYGAVLSGSIELLTHVDVARPWRDLVALSPMLPAAAMAWVILRELRRMDELQRRIQLEALGFSFAGTAILTFSYGFLEGLGYPRLSMFAVWPILAGLWIVGLMLARRRYQ
ncbi:MAG TPA: hypothetical protein VES00_18310 [Burkholderiaceae bacterium]|nr:hypothetical protein [Burkholderiaceae bacterium]